MNWIEFIPIPGTDKVRCPRCGKAVGHQRIARGAHAAKCLQSSATSVAFVPFFSSAAHVAALTSAIAAAHGTPFRQFGRVVGREGGLDCISFVELTLGAAGVGQGREFSFSRTAADYQTARTFLRILHMLRGQHDDPQSKALAEIFAELELPDDKTNLDPARFMPGDLVVLRDGGMFHIGVITAGRYFAHCIKPLGVQESNLHDPTFSNYLVAHFRARLLDPSRISNPESRITS